MRHEEKIRALLWLVETHLETAERLARATPPNIDAISVEIEAATRRLAEALALFV